MTVDFQTNNLIIFYFPSFSGGKFIMNCLSLSRHAVPLSTKISDYLINNSDDYKFRLQAVLGTLPAQHQMSDWLKWEFGDTDFYGGFVQDLITQWNNGQSTPIDSKLQNLIEKKLCFFMTRHGGAAESTLQVLQVWPNARIIMLTNYTKFWEIAINLKRKNQSNIDLVNLAGNDCQSKYELLAGPSWPSWNMFEKHNYDIDKVAKDVKIEDNIKTEIKQYYEWYKIKNSLFCIDVDNTYFFKEKFLTKIKELYEWLQYDDYNQDLIEEYYSKYISLHDTTFLKG
jgi:hypothetical protein